MKASRLNKIIPVLNGVINYAELNDWLSDNVVVFESEAIKVRKFGGGKGAVLILPPQAGHTSTIADYDRDQSLVECAIKNTTKSIYCIEWKTCTPERNKETYADMVSQVMDAYNVINDKDFNIVGLCQGGVLATVFTALNPELVTSLTVAGAPVDVQKGGVLDEAIKQPMMLYKFAVGFMGKGMMLGDTMLECWKSANPAIHKKNLATEPTDYKTARFHAWYYKFTSNLAGTWYLDLVKNLFKENALVRGKFNVGGVDVKLGNIKCKLNLVTGTKDDISPPEHTLNMAELVSTKYQDINEYQGKAGHIGVFMGTGMIKNVWTPLFKAL